MKQTPLPSTACVMANNPVLNLTHPTSLHSTTRDGANGVHLLGSASKAPCADQSPITSHGTYELSSTNDQNFTAANATDEPLSWGYLSQQVFLSHSGKQKNFVEQLHEDLKRASISSFFDKYSLLKGEPFPLRIFQAARKCRIAIVVLSKDYIASKWPMEELCAFVQAQETINSNLKIYPLFYKMSPDQLYQEIQDIETRGFSEYWENIGNSSTRPIEFKVWLDALKALRSFNGRLYNKEEGKVEYRRKILADIRRLLPPSIQYEDTSMKGKERLCREVEMLFGKTPYYGNGVKVAGLYGIGGSGKTTLCKSLCNSYFHSFEGKVFHAEFKREGLSIESLKHLLQTLTDADEESVELLTSFEQGLLRLKQRMPSQRIFLALDNIFDTRQCIQEAQAYLKAGFADGSLILLTARSADILQRVIPEAENRSFMHIPNLNEEEAIEVLLNLTSVEACELTAEEKHIAINCVNQCYFMRERPGERNYHPLALTTYGAYLCEKFTCNLSQWIGLPNFGQYAMANDAQENIFYIFQQSFDALHPKFLTIFMLLNFYVPDFEFVEKFDYFDAVCKWLANVLCNENVESIQNTIHDLKKKGLIEKCQPNAISIHDLLVEFAESKLKKMECWISLEGAEEIPSTRRSISAEAIKFKACAFRSLSMEEFRDVSVLHLEEMRELKKVDFRTMRFVTSIIINWCRALEEIQGLECLSKLRYLRVRRCNSLRAFPDIRSLKALRHLKVQLPHSNRGPHTLDLTNCSFLEEIYLEGVCTVRISESKRLRNIRAITFKDCYIDMIGPLDLSECRQLHTIKLSNCSGLTSLNLTGCSNVRSISLIDNNSVGVIKDLDGLTALENLSLMEMDNVRELPSFERLTKLTNLNLCLMKNLIALPDLSNCLLLEKVDVSKCKFQLHGANPTPQPAQWIPEMKQPDHCPPRANPIPQPVQLIPEMNRPDQYPVRACLIPQQPEQLDPADKPCCRCRCM